MRDDVGCLPSDSKVAGFCLWSPASLGAVENLLVEIAPDDAADDIAEKPDLSEATESVRGAPHARDLVGCAGFLDAGESWGLR